MQKQSIHFKLLLCLFFLSMVKINSQAQSGLNFQGVARSSNNVILASQQISLRLSILQGSATGTVEYSEIRKVTTNAQGLFAVVIGDADATSTMGNFSTINWRNTPKYLKIEMDATAGSNFITMGTTQFQYVAYAQFASSVDAENIVGVVPVNKGGTGVTNMSALKTSLALDKINNTADVDKPISSKTQTALDLKLNAADTNKYAKQVYIDSLQLTKFNLVDTVNYVKKSYIDAALLSKFNVGDTLKYTKQAFTDSSLITKLKLSDTANMLSNRIGKDTLNLSARINAKASTVDVNAALALKSNTSDVNTSLALKANASDVITSLLSKLNKTDTSYLLQRADTSTLSNRINLKANASDVTTSLSGKVDKVTGKVLSSNDYTNEEKIKLAAITGTNTGDQDLSTYATNAALALKANTSDVNTSLALKANASEVATSLSGKVDKVTGKVLSSNDYTNEEKIKLAAISGTNTGDESEASIKSKLGVTGFFSGDYSDLYNKPDLNLKENANNKTTDINMDAASDIKFPSVKAIKNYVDSSDASLSNDLVSLTSNQNIEGQKTLKNDLIMGEKPGLLGTPTTINFANGSKIGDIQNITEGNPDFGSIDLYAPDGAKWVQLNYGNTNYISLEEEGAYIYFGNHEWQFKGDGTSWFPGDLSFADNHFINFTSSGSASPTTNVSISSNGPYLKIKSRVLTANESNDDINYGVELNYADRSILQLKKNWMNFYNEDDDSTNDDYLSSVDFNYNSFNFFIKNKEQQFNWLLNEDGSTALPGKLTLSQKTSDDFGVTITSPRPEKPIIQDPDKLGSSIGFISDINSGTTSNTAFIQLNPQGDMIFRTLQQKMSFQNYGNEAFEYKFKIPEDILNNIPEHTKTTMSINNDNVYIDGSLTLGNTNYPKLGGDPGQVLTMDSTGLNAIWITPTNTVTSTSNITSINGVASGTQSLTTGNSGSDFSIESDTVLGVHTFNIPNASSTKRGLLTSADFSTFFNKQNALSNPLTGSGLNVMGEIPFFNGTNTTTSDPNLFWDATNKRLGISTQSPGYPIEINTGAANYGLMISSESTNTWGSGIGFKSSTDAATKTGLFQLDRDGAMVFRTLQDNMYFDNAGTGSMIFRMGNPNSNIGMTLNNSGNLEISGTLKTGSVLYPKEVGNNGDVLTFDSLTNKAIWQAPAITNSTVTVEASTLSGTTLNSTIINSNLTSVGVLNNATVNGKVIVGATSEVSSSAIIEASSTSKGFLPPRMSYYQRNQIESPVAGLTIWCNNCGASGEMQVFNGGAWTNMIGGTTTSPLSLSIGDSYQGGKVAYILQSGDIGYDANTQHGIIAATSDQSSRIMWYNGISSNTGATATGIGAGLSNTNLIISTQGAIITDYAAGVARSYNGGGYKDWYLPSKEELKKLYQNKVAIGGFSDIPYWSSSEIDESRAVLCDFWNGSVNNFDKFATALVRAVRSF